MSDCSLQLFSNNGVALLDADISASDLSITVQPGLGSLFPQPSIPGEWFVVTLEDAASPLTREIVKVIAVVGDTFTVDPAGRGYENSPALAWVAGDTIIDHRVTAETLRCLQNQPNNFGVPINGTPINVGDTEIIGVLDASGPNKTCKWMITVQTADNRIVMTEVLAVFKPTSPMFNQYAKVGDKISYVISVSTVGTDMVLEMTNTDISTFTSVDVIRIQHYT